MNAPKKPNPPVVPALRRLYVQLGTITPNGPYLRPHVLSTGSCIGGRSNLVGLPVLKLDRAGKEAAIVHINDPDHDPDLPFATNVPVELLEW